MSRASGARDVAAGAAFGAWAGVLEAHAYYLTTASFDLPSALAFAAYGAMVWAVLAAVVALLRRVRLPGRLDAVAPVTFLGVLLLGRCIVDGEAIRFATRGPLLAWFLAVSCVGVAAWVAAGLWLAHRAATDRVGLAPAAALGAVGVVYGPFLTRVLLDGRTGGAWYALTVAVAVVATTLAFGVGLRAPRRRAALALVALLALSTAVRAVVEPPDANRVRHVPPGPAVTGTHGPSVVLIVLDTVRADHMDLYGYERVTMPHLTEFARDARVYLHCLAASSWSLPSHATLFTGLPARRHGAHYGAAERGEPTTPQPLGDDAVTLAEVLAGRGYRTVGISANHGYVSPSFGLDQGFQHWDSRSSYRGAMPRGFRPLLFRSMPIVERFALRAAYEPLVWFDVGQVQYRRAEQITRTALDVMDREVPSGAPFFLFLNYMDAHDPYRAPGDFADAFPGRLRDRPRDWSRDPSAFADLSAAEIHSHFASEYDSELRYLDFELDRLLEGLESRGRLEDTIVVITSDHGEQLFEHGDLHHGNSLFEEEVRVPLIIDAPGVGAARIDHLVAQRDVMPWLLERMGLPLPPGVEPSGLDRGEGPHVAELYGTRRGDLTAYREGSFKFVRISGGEDELYDLDGDPGERTDIAQARPDVSTRMREEVRAWIRSIRPAERSLRELDPEQRDLLRDLGYLQ